MRSLRKPAWFTRERAQVFAYLFVTLMAMVAVATYDANQRNKTETRIIERLQPQITRIEQTIAGATGPTGAQGSTGTSGSPGKKGSRGTVGSTGASGLRGFLGPIGPQGERGPRGFPGIQGPVGPQGPAGQVNSVANNTLAQLQAEVNQLRALVCDLSPTC